MLMTPAPVPASLLPVPLSTQEQDTKLHKKCMIHNGACPLLEHTLPFKLSTAPKVSTSVDS